MTALLQHSNVILCGGFGKRLRPIVSDRQKVLAAVIGRPFITYILDQISYAGGKDVILCTGFLGEQIEIMLGYRYKGLSLRYSRETEPLGTAGAIRNAIDMIRSETLIVFNGDSYCDINPKDLLEWHYAKNSSCTLVLVKVPDVGRYGSVHFDFNHLVTSFDEKTSDRKDGWINAGVYSMCRSLIECLPEKKNVSLEKDFFPSLIGEGFYAFPQDAAFIDIGTPNSYEDADTFFNRMYSKRESRGC